MLPAPVMQLCCCHLTLQSSLIVLCCPHASFLWSYRFATLMLLLPLSGCLATHAAVLPTPYRFAGRTVGLSHSTLPQSCCSPLSCHLATIKLLKDCQGTLPLSCCSVTVILLHNYVASQSHATLPLACCLPLSSDFAAVILLASLTILGSHILLCRWRVILLLPCCFASVILLNCSCCCFATIIILCCRSCCLLISYRHTIVMFSLLLPH